MKMKSIKHVLFHFVLPVITFLIGCFFYYYYNNNKKNDYIPSSMFALKYLVSPDMKGGKFKPVDDKGKEFVTGKEALDPWGKPYHLKFTDEGKCELRCSGADCLLNSKDDILMIFYPRAY